MQVLLGNFDNTQMENSVAECTDLLGKPQQQVTFLETDGSRHSKGRTKYAHEHKLMQ